MEPKGISKVTKNLEGFVSKNSPTLLTILAVGGLFGTVIFAAKATPKAMKLIGDEKYDRWEKFQNDELNEDASVYGLTNMEIVKLTWKCYIPAAALGAATIACIVGSNAINHKRNVALATVYGLTDLAFSEYKAKVVETLGKNKELKVRDDISADHLKENPVGKNEVIFTGKGEVLCYDSLSGRYFKSDIEKIRKSVNELNKEFMMNMWISLNDLYYELGLGQTVLGDQMGWDLNKGLMEISFSSQLTENEEPCLVLNYTVVPRFMD